MQGFQTDGWGSELEEWIFQKREALAAKARLALVHMAHQEASRQDFDRAAQYALRAYEIPNAPELEIEDFEILYTLLQAGHHPKAKDIRKEAQEFGIDLQLSETEARQTLVAPKLKQITLPHQNTAFIGRETEKAQLAQQLSQCHLLTLIGPGGMGKTRLSLALAQEQLEFFPDGVCFVALDTVTSADLMVFALADALGIHLVGQDPKTQVCNYLQHKHLLLVLDNLEHLVDDVSFIQELLTASPSLKILATSRESLGLQSEYLFDVQGLELPKVKRPEMTEALQLFADRAKQHRQDFVLDEQTLPTVAAICGLVDGMPLAIELAASWLRVLSLSELLQELREQFRYSLGNG